MRVRWVLMLVIAMFAFTAAACGDDEEEGGGGGGAAATEESSGGEQTTANAKKAPTLEASQAATGDVIYCTGKDTSGGQKASVEEFNKANPDMNARLLEFPESADEQRNQFVQRQEAQSGDCDIFYADVVWTAEFASQGWLLDMTDYVTPRKDEFIPATLSSITFEDKYFGTPKQTDAGLLFYRSDQVDEVPATWQAVYEDAAAKDGIVYQGAPYEGLTVDFLEFAFAAGGKVISDDGTKSEFDSPENVKALQFMVDGIESGAAPKAVTTYKEEEARRAFEAGRATYMRNWPYAYGLGKESDIADDFEVAPYPEFEGGQRASVLGGHNLVISAFSKNPEGSVKLIDFLTNEETMKRDAAEYSLAPVLNVTYEDADVKKALPFSAELKQAVEAGFSRPVSPVYPQISSAIYKNVNAALAGRMAPEEAIKAAHEEIDQALATF